MYVILFYRCQATWPYSTNTNSDHTMDCLSTTVSGFSK